MPQDQIIKPAGLFTDPNPLSAAPRGAMREAMNVVIRRDGIVQPRPGFELVVPSVAGASRFSDIARMIAWNDSLLVVNESGNARFAELSSGDITSDDFLLTGGPGSGFAVRAAESRDNLYVTSSQGVARYENVTDDPVYSGLDGRTSSFVSITATGSGTGYLAAGKQAAYRVVFKRKIGGFQITSSPSARGVANGYGVADDVSLVFAIDTAVIEAGDVLQLYRSVSTDSTASDDLFLLKEITITSSHVSAKSITIADIAPDTDLGASLYTNDDQEGINQQNDPPPRVTDLALFHGSLFGSNVSGRKSIILSWSYNPAVITGDATEIGARVATVTTTIGTPNLTAVSSNTGWTVGSIIIGAGIPNGTRITAVGVGTATMSANATASATVGAVVHDVLQILDSQAQSYIMSTPSALANAVNLGTVAGTCITTSGSASTYWKASVISDVDDTFEDGMRRGSVLIEARDIGESTFLNFNATKYTLTTPEASAIGTALSADNDNVSSNRIKNGLIYSKQDQPEAMPYPVNLIRVGSSSHGIDRILATRDALFIFKRDGIFRLSGSGAPNWRVDPFDASTYLIAHDSAVVLGEAIFAWTNYGVVRITDSGVQKISALSIGNELRRDEILSMIEPINDPDGALPYGAAIKYGWALANTKDNEYILCTNSANADGFDASATRFYVYNTKTDAWTRWRPRERYALSEWITAGVMSSDQKIVFGGGYEETFAALSVERNMPQSATGQAPSYDWVFSSIGPAGVTVTPRDEDAVAQIAGTIFDVQATSAPVEFVPAVGDRVTFYADGGVGTIIEVTDAANFAIYFPDAVYGETYDEFDLTEGIATEVEFSAKIAAVAGATKRWTDGTVVWGTSRNMERYTVSFSSATRESDVSAVERLEEWPDNAEDFQWTKDFWVPRNHARSSALFVGLSIAQADSPWQLYGITLTNAAMSPQVSR